MEIRDGMRIGWDVPIEMDDGNVLRADVFLPLAAGRYPVVLTYGPYAKGLSFQDGNAGAWEHLTRTHPEVLEGSSNKYQSWELVDPEKWVPDGYALLRVDSRGTGRSPGMVDPYSPRETQDIVECIEWAGTQDWSNGKVGMNGISYYAINAWQAAALRPPHLAAIVCWEGSTDYYREGTHHGGIASQFLTNWFPRAVHRAQHGCGERGARSRVTGELVCGPETLAEDVLEKNRIDMVRWIQERPLEDRDHLERTPELETIVVPVLSTANWGGQGLHTRGNFEGFVRIASTEKWLEAHGGAHWESFYTDEGIALQKQFLGHFLKGEDTGWQDQPRVSLQVRHVDRFVARAEEDWPLPRTQWTRFYLDPSDCSLRRDAAARPPVIAFEAMGDGVMFLTPPLPAETEITGPIAARLRLSSSTADADLFLVLRVFTPDGAEITFHGSNDPRTPIGLGWLRASHRKLDPARSLPYRPYHSHDEKQPLTPGEPVDLDVEIWPTCIVVPAGYRIGLSVRGKDYRYPGPPLVNPLFKYSLTGVGPFLHEDPVDRPAELFAGTTTLHFDAGAEPYLLLPVIPSRL